MAENSNSRQSAGKSAKDKAKTMNGLPQPQAAINDMLGAKLKAYYGEIVSEPIPDRLMALMAELEAQSAIKKPPEETALIDDGKDR